MGTNAKTWPAFPHSWGLAPDPQFGPKAMPIDLDFSSLTTIDFDLWTEETQHILPNVQSAWFDNSVNPNPLLVIFGPMIRQRIIIPAFSQATRPVFSGNQTKISASTAATLATTLQMILLNVPVPIFTTPIV